MDRSLTYRRHLESLRKKLTSRIALLRRLASSGWDAKATTLRTATLALVHSTAEYCAPVWSRSAHTSHQRRLGNGDCMRASYTSGQPSNPRRHPTCWAFSQWSHTVSSTPCPGAWTLSALTRLLSADARHLKNRDTHLYPPYNSSVHLTTTYVRHTGWITNGMRSGRTTPQESTFSSPTPAPTSRGDPPKKSLGPA